MKNDIVTCLKDTHPIYNDSFKREKIKIGKSYKCVDELVLTSPEYFKPEFASLSGITIRSKVDKWGWSKPCLPKDCFRIATQSEIRRYKISIILNAPFRFFKVNCFKIIHKIDRIARRKYYQSMADEYLG